MTYQELLASAKENFQNTCKACPVCNGAACRGLIPGPGGKGTGEGFVRSFQKLAEIKLNLDTIYEEKEADLSFDFFGHRVAMPVFAAPIGAMPTHYGPLYTEKEYVKELVEGLSRVGLMAFTLSLIHICSAIFRMKDDLPLPALPLIMYTSRTASQSVSSSKRE